MFMNKEKVSNEEAEKIIDDLTEGYKSDGFSEMEARSMALADFDYYYEKI